MGKDDKTRRNKNLLIVSLKEALNDPIWINHKIGDIYIMDGVPGWKIAYYPIFEDGKTGELYIHPKALVEKPAIFKGIKGTDFREVPLHFLIKEN